MSMPAMLLNISPATRDDALPLEKLSFPGCALAYAINSPAVRIGRSGFTSASSGVVPTSVTGAKSLIGS